MEVLRHFFTHKDFLPPPEQWPGTLFTPLQIGFCGLVAVLIAWACVRCAKQSEARQKTVFTVLWAIMLITELGIDVYGCCAGKRIFMDWAGVLPLWHCSIFLYAAPFAIFGKGWVRQAACGYICTLGLLGGVVNFVYPATYLASYSCISMAGFRTVFYHGAMVFTAVTMLLSGYHRFRGVTRWQQLLLPAVPALLVSIPALIVDMLVPEADYMFFKLQSFFLAPIGRATPDWLSALIVYAALLAVHALPYLPSYVANRKKAKAACLAG